MSLNGLDEVAVAEAHQAALAEAGGWFLLNYINRDTVALLKKGTGGIQEVRSVIEQYDEKSPLYGLLQYRRKRVILKYVPEGTSRLLQVRLTVQFQSVLEAFSPHDTVFSLTAASELTDSALGLCTMLLPSAASLTSSSSSLRRRRLDEITEDAEETTLPTDDTVTGSAPLEEPPTPTYGRRELDELPASAVLAKALLAKRKEEAVADAQPDTSSLEQETQTPRPPRTGSLAPRPLLASEPPSFDKSLPATPESTPPATREDKADGVPDFEVTSNILLGAAATITPAQPRTGRLHIHHLSVAESDSISQWSNNVASYAAVKPKKKLGPRPHAEADHRPKTSGTTEGIVNVRPVANLPNTIRVNARSALGSSLRPGSQQSTRSVPGRFAPTSYSIQGYPHLPSPTYLEPLHIASVSRPTPSRPASVATEVTAATPEKLRLMKALQLRKRNMLLAQRASSAASPASSNANIHDLSDSSVSTYASSSQLTSIPSQEQLSNINEESKAAQSPTTTSPTFMTNISEEPSTKASSFTERDDVSHKRRSLSSATSSSVTPKPGQKETKSANTSGNDDTATIAGLEIANTADDQPHGTFTGGASAEDEKPVDRDEPSALSREGDLASVNAMHGTDNDTSKQSSDSAEPDTADSIPNSDSTSKLGRLTPTQPLRILPSGDTSTSDASEDEALMEELQHATVQEAKPVSVARSPVTPIVSRRSSDKLRETVSKSTTPPYQTRRSAGSTPDRKSFGSIRSTSTALPQWPPMQVEPAPVPLTKKPTLGSGISRRIKALEVLTTKDANPQPAPPPVREASGGRAGFSAFLKRSAFLPTQHPPNASTETSPPKKLHLSASQYDPDTSTMTSTLFGHSSKEVRGPLQKGDTISVTARIVRDTGNKRPPMSPSSSYHTPLNLFRSPLIVEHEKHEELPQEHSFASLHSLTSLQSITKSPTKSDRGRFSFSSHRSASQTNLPHLESTTSRVSLSSPHKKGPRSASDAASSYEEKTKGSRTSRLMKRMSNLTSPRNKNHSSKEPSHPSTIQEQSELTRHDSTAESLMQIVDIGDVNVQFPESLLWKRRFVRVDDQGYLIFSPPMTDANMKSISRRYHLSDFNRPTLPDLEREEMAWSVLLDFKDGRCIQCACEGRHAQEQVLRMLVDAHNAYHQLYEK